MKSKSLILMSIAVLFFGLGIPAGADGIDYSGSLNTDIQFSREVDTPGWNWETYSKLNLNVKVPVHNVSGSGVLQVQGVEKFSSDNNESFSFLPSNVNIEQAYLDLNTSLWPYGPSGNLRVGKQVVPVPLLGTMTDHAGIVFTDVAFDDINTQLIYVWGNEGTTSVGKPTFGIHASRYANNGTGILFSMLGKDKDRNMGVAATANFLRGRMFVEAGRVVDANDQKKLYANVASVVTNDLTIRLHANETDSGFSWIHPVRDVFDEDQDGDTAEYLAVETGQRYEVVVESLGHQALVVYKWVDDGSDETTTVAIEKLVNIMSHPLVARYKREISKINDVTQTFGGRTVVNLGAVQDVELSAEYVLAPSSHEWDLGARYMLTSGLGMNVGYNSKNGVRIGSSMLLVF